MSLLELAEAWVAQDPDPKTQSELQVLIDQANLDQIGERFAQLAKLRLGRRRGGWEVEKVGVHRTTSKDSANERTVWIVWPSFAAHA